MTCVLSTYLQVRFFDVLCVCVCVRARSLAQGRTCVTSLIDINRVLPLQLFITECVSCLCLWLHMRYTGTRGLRFIGDNDLKLLWQIFAYESNVNLPGDNDFLYRFFFSNYDLKMSKITIFYINFFGNYDLKMSKIYLFLSYTNIAS